MATEEAAALEQRGLSQYKAGDYVAALESFARARQLYADQGDPRGVSEALNDIGVIYYRERQWSEAEANLRAARDAAVGAGHRDKEAQALGNLGSLYARLGRIAEAEECFNQAVALFRALGDEENAQATLKALSDLTLKRGSWFESVLHYDRRLAAISRPNLWQRAQIWILKALKRLAGI